MSTQPHEVTPPELPALTHTRKQASERLHISESMLDELIASKQLRAVKLGRRVLILETDLQRLLADHMTAIT